MELEELVQLIDDDVLQESEGPALLGGELEKAGEDGGHLDDGEVLLLLALFGFEVHGDVQGLVGQHGEGAAAVYRQGGEDREEDLPEVLGDVVQLFRGHVLAAEEAQALLCHGRADGPVQAGVLALHEFVGFFLQKGEKLLGGEVEIVFTLIVGVDLGLDPGHPHHEEFVQVGAGDGQKAQALHEGVLLFGGLFQDTGVEVHPAQLAVVIGQFFLRHGVPSFLYG